MCQLGENIPLNLWYASAGFWNDIMSKTQDFYWYKILLEDKTNIEVGDDQQYEQRKKQLDWVSCSI